MTFAPLLRAPPFPEIDASVTWPETTRISRSESIEHLFAAIRAARVGGHFWGRQAGPNDAAVIVRAAAGETEAVLSEAEREVALLLDSSAPDPVDPWSLLREGTRLVAHGDDEWVAIAAIAGAEVRLLSRGRFGAPGDDAVRLKAVVAADLMRTRYRDPFTGAESDLATTIAVLADWRRTLDANRGIVAGCGFSWWKRREITRFLSTPAHPLRLFHNERRAVLHAARKRGALAIWPSRVSDRLIYAACAQGVPLVRVEDGFVRSVGLGSNLVPPLSVAVDRRGIHYDPTEPSDLEVILADMHFPPILLARAERLRATILAAGISKYGHAVAHAFPPRSARRLVLVPGQVEDDMSVRLGGGGLASNLDLLRRARALEPEAEIWFRPHPDVDAGHRTGAVRDADALAYADRIVRGGGMGSLLEKVDAVHVLTSLTGFEALLRGCDVTCHGTPFYAGWGLTRDIAPIPERRGRSLTLAELIAGVLIVYPRYLDPVTGLPCSPELLIRRMQEGAPNRLGWATRLRQMQGRLLRWKM